ncbi:type I-E CRISPR-associated protein Cas6/Cse3/CasE [Leptolyngbya sp. 'hensonii']|uniref:type I-E CRISPR-associated protein Cas6/Cse3/CasE n=1 Tax=Leptolyngbya sp. 'hensonii' TaxID=1922337 RepID=UPI00094FE254|nr:type I-E CRISPR-associated protein Cas6/Cse3/CasE [Leptolyngbya sp. 'hensonii']OLP18279.1 type I-E CRISPR-associated protein Cas6/Cse3/CasE [Leptolyngbya sp. 'hensonii']
MYLSKLVLNERDRTVQYDLSNAHALHQRIMQAFPDEQRDSPRADWNVLFRQEPASAIVLVQSGIQPNWTHLPTSYLTCSPNFTHVDLEASRLESGRIFQFRLKANPSKRDNQTRKLIGMFHQSDQMTWLERQASQHGFQPLGVDVIPTPNVFGVKGKGKAPIRMLTVLYQGVLQITDSALFIAALQQGIGRGRSYGCGLLSIAKLNPY